MTRQITVVATTARSTTVQPEGRAVSLDVSQTLAVIALFRFIRVNIARDIVGGKGRILSVVRGRGQPLDSWPRGLLIDDIGFLNKRRHTRLFA